MEKIKETLILSNSDKDINTAIKLLKEGKVICFKTDTIYGFSCDATNKDACKQIVDIKGRENKPFILLAKNKEMVYNLATNISKQANCLMENVWPGPITIILDLKYEFCDEVTAGKNTIGLRVPNDPLCNKILTKLDFPIVSTSANISGQQPLNDFYDIFKTFNGKVDAIIDSGKVENNIASTICIATNDNLNVIREGAITTSKIMSLINKI